jgi:hypothetical protein
MAEAIFNRRRFAYIFFFHARSLLPPLKKNLKKWNKIDFLFEWYASYFIFIFKTSR